MPAPFVSIALKICDVLEIHDKRGSGMVMRFSKMYSPEKMARIVDVAKSFHWREQNPVAAFMKAVGIVNKEEKYGRMD